MKSKIEFGLLLEGLKSRSAVKSFMTRLDKDMGIASDTQDLIEKIKDILRLSPSSYGLQPYKFIFITNQDILKKLRAHSYGQPQVIDSDFLVVFCAHTKIDELFIDKYLDLVSQVRGISKEKLEEFGKSMKSGFKDKNESQKVVWAARQAYIALGNALTSLALLGIDCCPMEGFDPQGYDDLLGLTEKNLTAVVLLAVGKKSDQSPSHSQNKVRFPHEALFLDYN